MIDALYILILTALATSDLAGSFRISPPHADIVSACRIWVAPILTFLGLICATNAFIFTAVERSEFSPLRKLGVEGQLWQIFSEIIFWLAVSTPSAAVISFIKPHVITDFLVSYLVFLFLIVCLCLLKFAWLMREIIAVRIRASNN